MATGSVLVGSSLLLGPLKANWPQEVKGQEKCAEHSQGGGHLKSGSQGQPSPKLGHGSVSQWTFNLCYVWEESHCCFLTQTRKQMGINKTKRNGTGPMAMTHFVDMNTRKERCDSGQQHPVHRCFLATTGWRGTRQRELQRPQTTVPPIGTQRSQGGNQVSTREQPTNL